MYFAITFSAGPEHMSRLKIMLTAENVTLSLLAQFNSLSHLRPRLSPGLLDFVLLDPEHQFPIFHKSKRQRNRS